MYKYNWLPGSLVQPALLEDFAALYSNDYGVWGALGPKPGQPVRLSADRIKNWLVPDSLVVWATAFGKLIGYAIAVQTKLSKHGTVSLVTQLVVDEAHRRQNVGKTLLFAIWRFTDHFAWGIVSANPYAVRALEKATRRRCQPTRIEKYSKVLTGLAKKVAPYLKDAQIVTTANESRANTVFFLDHSGLQSMLSAVVDDEKPWQLGPLAEGWEWFAFTLQEQDQINLTKREQEEMLAASDEITKYAYSQMAVGTPGQAWSTHQETEIDFIIQNCGLRSGNSVIDFGCGQGRHTIGLALKGMQVTGIDYLPEFVRVARERADKESALTASFVVDDCRTVDLGKKFDAGICLYDVVGTYAEERENLAVLQNLVKHTRDGGLILLSVMNMELTERNAKNWFSLQSEPDKLLTLRPSNTMQTTGNVFNPDFYMIDRDTKIVYRKEQFMPSEGLPEEVIVRDRRYTEPEIQQYCIAAGLEIIWSRFVRSGKWNDGLSPESEKAKEILVLCRKPSVGSPQGMLFS